MPDSLECAAMRADTKGDRLNSRFQYIHENESVKAHGVVQEELVIVQDEYHCLDEYWSMAIRCQH